MSTLKSNNENMTINADGASSEVKFQANGVEKASISSAGAFTSTTIDATALTGNLPAISGASLTGVGKVLQVKAVVDTTSTAISSTSWTDIGLSLSITPQTNSNILVSFNLQAHISGGNYGYYVRLLRDTTVVHSNGNTDPDVSYYDSTGSTDMRTKGAWTFLDSSVGGDGSTSITYKVQARTVSARTVTFSSDSASCEMSLTEIGV